MPQLWVPWTRCSLVLWVRREARKPVTVDGVTGTELVGKAHPVCVFNTSRWHLSSPLSTSGQLQVPQLCAGGLPACWSTAALRQMLLMPFASFFSEDRSGLEGIKAYGRNIFKLVNRLTSWLHPAPNQESKQEPDLLSSAKNTDHSNLLGFARHEKAGPWASKTKANCSQHRAFSKCIQYWEMQITLQVYKKLSLNNNYRASQETVF